MAENKVQFGLKNVHYALWDSENNKYGEVKAMPGAVSLSLDTEGDTSKFYADDVVYYTSSTNAGYTGTLEIAYLEKSVRTELLGDIEDTNGLVLEATDAQPADFALMFEIDGNANKQGFVLYSSKLSRPSTEANTKEDTTEPQTQSLDITCIGRNFTVAGETRNIVKGIIESTVNADTYAKFFTEVVTPTETAASKNSGTSTKAAA